MAKPPYLNQSLDRGLTILELFHSKVRSLSAKEISDLLGVLPTTLYPFLHTLVHHGYLEVDDRKRYRLGLKLLERAGQVSSVLDVRAVARNELESLSRDLLANTRLAVLHDNQVLYLERMEGGPDVTLGEVVGVAVPPHCTALGKVLLAYLPEQPRSALLRSLELQAITPHTITDRETLERALAETRMRGYAVENEEFHLGGACVAAPVFGSHGRVIAAISTSLLASRAREEAQSIAEAVVAAADRISARLGHGVEAETQQRVR